MENIEKIRALKQGLLLLAASLGLVAEPISASSALVARDTTSAHTTLNLASFTSAPMYPTVTSADKRAVVSMGLQTGVSPMGAANFSIPIEVVPGVHGMQPQLSIAYSSQSGKGVMGMGCSLTGTSCITRSTRDVAHDEQAHELTYDRNDAFSLDGKRMVLVSGTSGEEGAVYHLESDPYTQIVLKHGDDGALYFDVTMQQNMHYRYGSSANSRQNLTVNGKNVVCTWGMDYADDAYHNFMTYHYMHDGQMLYLDHIEYGGNENGKGGVQNEVVCSYEDAGTTAQHYFAYGSSLSLAKRLSSISVKSDSRLFREYRMQYGTSANGRYAYLKSVTESNGNGETLKPVTFEWKPMPQTGMKQYEMRAFPANVPGDMPFDKQYYIAHDMNGDGLTDLIGIAPVDVLQGNITLHDNYAYVYYASLGSDQKVQFMQGKGFELGSNVEIKKIVSDLINGISCMDFDGNGKSELVVPHLYAFKGNPTIAYFDCYDTEEKKTYAFPLQSTNELPLYTMADFNNDGKSELILIEKAESGKNCVGHILYNMGTSPARKTDFTLNLKEKPEKVYASDLNGDGSIDLIFLTKTGYEVYWNSLDSQQNANFNDSRKMQGDANVLHNTYMIHTGDFDGNGLVDFIYNEEGDANWYWAINLGNGHFRKTLAFQQQGLTKQRKQEEGKISCQVLDFDNDGRTDVVITKGYYTSKGKFEKTRTFWLRNTGSGLVALNEASSKRDADNHEGHFVVGDFNGDGVPEMVNYGYECYGSADADINASWHIYGLDGYDTGCGKVSTTMDNLGNSTTFHYATLTQSQSYKALTDAIFPLADLTSPIPVVETVVESNGCAEAITTAYSYKGLKAHRQGRGLLGFTEITSTSRQLGRMSQSGITAWNSRFCIPSSTYSIESNKDGYCRTDIDYTIVDKGDGTYFAYPGNSSERDYDKQITVTTQQYDSLGYLVLERIDYPDHSYKETVYSKYNKKRRIKNPALVVTTQKLSSADDVYTHRSEVIAFNSAGESSGVLEYYPEGNLRRTVFRDPYGNISSENEFLNDDQSQTDHHNYKYDTSHRWLVEESANQQRTTYTNDFWGNRLTECNRYSSDSVITATYAYDGWGNQISQTNADGTAIVTETGWGNTQDKNHYVYERGFGLRCPWTLTWYDSKGREVSKQTVGAGNLNITDTKSYNVSGLLVRSEHTEGNIRSSEDYTYDARNRMLTDKSSTGKSTTYSYGVRSAKVNENGRVSSTTYDVWGNVVKSTSPTSSLSYTYTSQGVPSEIKLPDGTCYLTFDGQGNRTYMDDPDAGPKGFTYGWGGLLQSSLDYKGNTENYEYDSYHRVKKHTNNDLETDYTYATGVNFNQAAYIRCGENSIARAFDNCGRVISEAHKIGDKGLLTHSYRYNEGVLKQETYPNGLEVSYTYDDFGYLCTVTAGNRLIWKRLSDTGTESQSQLGQNLTSTLKHNAQGWLIAEEVRRDGTLLHAMEYDFDAATGNLNSRKGMLAEREQFTYDSENRLTSATSGNSSSQEYSYSRSGNIQSKTGIGEYTYDGMAPHAVTEVENTDGIIPDRDQRISYTPFDKVSLIVEQKDDEKWMYKVTYGPEHQRWASELTVSGNPVRSVIYDDDYECIQRGDTLTRICYLHADGRLVALYVQQNEQPGQVLYAETDHLGSIIRLTDSIGTVVFAASYDAWGKRTIETDEFHLYRGFTGHEHLDEFGLIDMNGRMYDPALGRFLSPDPYVQMADYAQNYNRYSYCLNNPLKYTDPSGKFAILPFLSAVVTGAAIGAGMSAVSYSISTWITGQSWNWNSFATSIGMGAVSGALGGAISSVFAGTNFVNSIGFNMLSGTVNNVVTDCLFNGKPDLGNILPIWAGSAMGLPIPSYPGNVKSKVLNGICEALYNSGKNAVTGATTGLAMALRTHNFADIKRQAIGGAVSGFYRSALMDIIFGAPYRNYKVDAETGGEFRSGGIAAPVQGDGGLTMGKHMFVAPGDRLEYNRYHEYKHTVQIKEDGWARFYGKTVLDYIKYGFYNSYNVKGTYEYEANDYANTHAPNPKNL